MDDTALRRQYDALIEGSGLRIAENRAETMFGAYKQVRTWADVVRSRRPAVMEPSNTYQLNTVGRLTDAG